jgi:hypothetical protein
MACVDEGRGFLLAVHARGDVPADGRAEGVPSVATVPARPGRIMLGIARGSDAGPSAELAGRTSRVD